MAWILIIIAGIAVGILVAYIDEPNQHEIDKKVTQARSEDMRSKNVDVAEKFDNVAFSNDGKQLWLYCNDEGENQWGQPRRVRFDLTVGKRCNIETDDLTILINTIAMRVYVSDGRLGFDATDYQRIVKSTYGLTAENGGYKIFNG